MYLGVALAASHVGMPAVGHAGWIDIFHRQVPHSRNVRSRLASLAMGSLNHQVSLTCCRTRPNPSAQSASRHPGVLQRTRMYNYQQVAIVPAWSIVVSCLNRAGLATRHPQCPRCADLR